MVGSPLLPGGTAVDANAVEELLRSGVPTIAEEIPQAGLPAPDFIQIEIEGWEIEALRGAPHDARPPVLPGGLRRRPGTGLYARQGIMVAGAIP